MWSELKGKNLLQGVQTFLLELTPTEKGGITEMVKLLPVHLKTFFCGVAELQIRGGIEDKSKKTFLIPYENIFCDLSLEQSQ